MTCCPWMTSHCALMPTQGSWDSWRQSCGLLGGPRLLFLCAQQTSPRSVVRNSVSFIPISFQVKIDKSVKKHSDKNPSSSFSVNDKKCPFVTKTLGIQCRMLTQTLSEQPIVQMGKRTNNKFIRDWLGAPGSLSR